jgi:hypothetical protein
MRRIGRLLLFLQVLGFAVFGGWDAAAEDAGGPKAEPPAAAEDAGEAEAGSPVAEDSGDGKAEPPAAAEDAGEAEAGSPVAEDAGDGKTQPTAAAEWGPKDAELAVLDWLAAAQRAEAWAAYADAVARLHSDAAVLARFGLSPPEEAQQLDGQRANAVRERDAAGAAKEEARAQLAERLVTAALRALPEPSADPPPEAEAAAGEDGAAGDENGEGAGGGAPAAREGGAGKPGAGPSDAGLTGGADTGGSAARAALPYPSEPLQAERAMRQACRKVEAADLLRKAGIGTTAGLAEAQAGCLQAELAWIDVQADSFAAILAGEREAGEPVSLAELLGMARDRQPSLYDRWVRMLKAEAACPSGDGGDVPAAVRAAGGVALERLPGCPIAIPGVRIENPQPAFRAAHGEIYLPLKPYAEALGLAVKWDGAERRIVLETGGTRLRAAPGSAVVEWSGGSHEMANAVLTVNGQSFVPAEFFRFLFGLRLHWDENVRAGWLLPESA